jgi:hypothetical protein
MIAKRATGRSERRAKLTTKKVRVAAKKAAPVASTKKVRVAAKKPSAMTASTRKPASTTPKPASKSVTKTRAILPQRSLAPSMTRRYDGSPAQERISTMLDEVRATNDDLEKRANLLLARLG